jgi:magnesium transporter
MEEKKEHITFEISEELIEKVEGLIRDGDDKACKDYFNELHYADIAEILDELNLDQATYVIKLLDSETTSEVLWELDEDVSSKILENLSAKEIAEELSVLDTDDAVDLLAELPEERQERVIEQLEDEELVADIQELRAYGEDTAGGLMAKELVKVYATWTVEGCLRRIRAQAENVNRVH